LWDRIGSDGDGLPVLLIACINLASCCSPAQPAEGEKLRFDWRLAQAECASQAATDESVLLAMTGGTVEFCWLF